jgi:hypothetical protein
VGQLNQISAAFNVLIVGLGGELGIHFSMRYLELLSSGRTRVQAVVETAESIGTSLLSSAVTTSIGLFIFLLTDFKGVAQLGVISGAGMYLSFLSTMTVLPAILMLGKPAPCPRLRTSRCSWRRSRSCRYGAHARSGSRPRCSPSSRSSRCRACASSTTCSSCATRAPTRSRRSRTCSRAASIRRGTIDVVTPSLDAARSLAGELEKLPTVDRAITLDDYVPKDQDQKRSILETAFYFVPAVTGDAAAPPAAEQRGALESLAGEAQAVGRGDDAVARSAKRLHGALRSFLSTAMDSDLGRLQANVVGSLPEQLRDLHPMLEPDEVGLDDVPGNLRQLMLAPDGRARVEVYPKKDVSNSEDLEDFVDSVMQVAPNAAGAAVWLVEWGRVTWGAMLRALFGGIALMALFLVLLWRSVWDTILAFLPVAARHRAHGGGARPVRAVVQLRERHRAADADRHGRRQRGAPRAPPPHEPARSRRARHQYRARRVLRRR